MISYTDTAKAVWQAGLQKQLTLVIDGTQTLTNSDILMESMSLRQSCNEESQFAIGNVYSSEFTVSVFADAPASAYVGKTIVPTLTAVDDEGNTYPQKLGEFEIASAKLISNRIHRELVCYDKLSPILQTDYSNWYNGLSFPMTIKYIRDAFFSFVGIQQETISLPNDNIQVQLTYSFDSLSGADLLKAICQVNGCWGFLDYDGNFKYKIVSAVTDNMLYPSETIFPSEVLFPGGNIISPDGSNAYQGGRNYVQGSLAFEEYKTSPITAVTVTQTTGEISVTSGTSGNTFTITENMLLYFVGETVMQTVADNLLANLEGLTYVPVSVKTAPTPWLEIGDWACFECDNEILYFPVMQRTFSGITAVMDTFTATGTEYLQENANSQTNRIASVGAKASATGNYFWVDANGAHVTQVPKSDIVADGWTGIYNSLVTSTDFQVRYGETPLASFGQEVTLGNQEDSMLHLTKDSIAGNGALGKQFFEFSGNGAADSVTYVYDRMLRLSDQYEAAPLVPTIDIPAYSATSGDILMTLNSVAGLTDVSYFSDTRHMIFSYGTADRDYITIKVPSTQMEYTVQVDYDGANTLTVHPIVGGYSNMYPLGVHIAFTNHDPSPTFELGGDCDATGAFAYAGGKSVTVSGYYSQAYGSNVSASGDNMAVFGTYNEDDANNIFEIGNGTASASANAFAVSRDNKAYADGNLLPQLKSVTFSGTTSASANIPSGININTGIVVGVQSDAPNSYAFIPFCRSDGTWYLHVMQANANQAALPNTAVSGTVYYLAF